SQRVEDVRVVPLFLQVVGGDVHHGAAVAVHAHAFQTVRVGGDQANLEVGRVGLEQQGEQAAEFCRAGGVCVRERGAGRGVAGEGAQGQRDLFAHQGDAAGEYARGGEQLVLG